MLTLTDRPQVDDAFIRNFFSAWGRRDVDGILDMVTDDAVLESAFGPEACGKRFVGKAEFRAAIERYFQTFPDIKSSDRTYTLCGDHGFTEVTVSYTDTDGRKVTHRVCDIFEFRDGKVASKRAYRKHLTHSV